jgi:hypothetical protein
MNTGKRTIQVNGAGEATMMRVVSRDGTEIACWTSGQGPPLVVVHGTPADHTRWRPLLPYLEPHATVHAMDGAAAAPAATHPTTTWRASTRTWPPWWRRSRRPPELRSTCTATPTAASWPSARRR